MTDTRITPRTVSRILAQEGSGSQGGGDSPPPHPPPRPYHGPPPMLPVSLPTSVAIPNPSLHESQVFSPYSPFFNPHTGHPGQVPPPGPHHLPASPPGGGVELRDSPPLPHPPAMLHPALLAAAQHGSPDYGHLRMDSNDRGSDCNSGEISYDGIQPTISFYLCCFFIIVCPKHTSANNLFLYLTFAVFLSISFDDLNNLPIETF